MNTLPAVDTPEALEWDRLRVVFPEVEALADCPQEPEFHGEGDVATHTRMVLTALGRDDRFWSLSAGRRSELAVAALLHDLGKPSTTRVEDGRIRQPGHARRGEILTRIALWERGIDVAVRERVANLVRFHLAPFHLLDRTQPTERLFRASWACDGVDSLLLLAAADATGRISATRDDLIAAVELARLFAEEHDVLDGPFRFANDHSRVEWFRRPDRDPHYGAHDSTRFEVVVLSGLPASGKDHWIRQHRPDIPVLSLDALRAELGVAPTARQAPVIAEARERARVHLRAGRPFVWNATNLSRRVRARAVELCLDYSARVRLVTTEALPEVIDQRNSARTRPVPQRAIDRMLHTWEYPDLTEAHTIDTEVTPL